MISLLDKCLSLRALAALSIIGAACVAAGENDYVSIPFLIAVFGAICSFVYLLSHRIRFALVTTWALLTVITAVSAIKFTYMSLGLHFYDAYFYLRDGETYRFLVDSYLPLLLISAFIFITGVAICVVLFRRELPVAGYRMKFGAIFMLSVAASFFACPNPTINSSYYLLGHRTSSLFVSFRELRFLLMKPAFAERLSVINADVGYQGMPSCSPKGSRPDIITVLMESAVPPSLYPEIKSTPALSDNFGGSDGRIRGLRVETFGGGTWISSTALMTSLPMIDFGWLRPFISVYLQGRVKHSLPTLLRQCGYKTAVISPLSYPFVNEGPFMTSLGIEDYRDFKKIGARSKHERDFFYFDAALEYIDKHHKTDDRPLFLFIMTMAAHGPYSYRFDPNTILPAEPFGNGGEMDEYLRRLTMQQMDFEAFKRELGDRKRGSILLDFGDHQPTVTRELAERRDGGKALAHWDSVAYHTYYRIAAINTVLAAPLPSHDLMDISYLGPTLFQAAGLPIDDVYAELLALRDECAGALFLCSQHERIERHLQRLAKSGMLKLDDARSQGNRSAQSGSAITGTRTLSSVQHPTETAN